MNGLYQMTDRKYWWDDYPMPDDPMPKGVSVGPFHLDPETLYAAVQAAQTFAVAVTEIFEPLPQELRDPRDIPHRVPNRAMRRKRNRN
jgi:hypothetical protein